MQNLKILLNFEYILSFVPSKCAASSEITRLNPKQQKQKHLWFPTTKQNTQHGNCDLQQFGLNLFSNKFSTALPSTLPAQTTLATKQHSSGSLLLCLCWSFHLRALPIFSSLASIYWKTHLSRPESKLPQHLISEYSFLLFRFMCVPSPSD